MMKFKLWDKKENINYVSAEEYLKEHPILKDPNAKMYLFYDEISGRIVRTEDPAIIRCNAIKIERDGTVYDTINLSDEENMQLLCDVCNGVASYYQELTPPTAEERIAAAMEYQNIMNY